MAAWVHMPLDEFEAIAAKLAKLEVENDRMIQALVNIVEKYDEAEEAGTPPDAEAMKWLAWDAQFEGGHQPTSPSLEKLLSD